MSTEPRAREAIRALDDRLTTGKLLRNQLNKIFPDHWSFMLGELALYSFVILILTGTYLAFFFNDSAKEIIYRGNYLPLRGLKMSEAYSSVLHIAFDVRAGLLIRQIHHWAALIFVAAICVHMGRIFFTGAFRKPRDINWMIGVTLLALSIIEGFFGYSLPDDLFSGTGLRIAYSIIESIPVVGSYIAVFFFAGQYPGNGLLFPRMFILHVFLLPGLIAALLVAHLLILWHQKHTQFPQTGRTERNVVGSHLWPSYSFKSQGLFFVLFAVLAFLGAYAQINPVWLWGPYNPAKVSAGSQPDWYMLWLEGTLRLMPHWESHFLGHTMEWGVFIPAVFFPILLFGFFYAYPFLERRVTKDYKSHELLNWPRDVPTRTGIGAAVIAFLLVVNVAGANDVTSYTFRFNMMAFTYAMRVLVLVLPVVAFFAARAFARHRQRVHALSELRPPPTAVVTLQPHGGYGVDQSLPRQLAQAPPEGVEAPSSDEADAPARDGRPGTEALGAKTSPE